MYRELLKRVVLKHKGEVLQPYDALLDMVGFDAVYSFSEMLGSTTVYIPNTKTIFIRCLEAEAAGEFNGCNYKTLAQKYGLSESHLRKVLRRHT
jgi:Mor family transcriptional regulator